jgi:protein-L-isoaspartate(D-aspartate) O-methyltransferase
MTAKTQSDLVSGLAKAVPADTEIIAAFAAVDRGDFVPSYMRPPRLPEGAVRSWPPRWESFQRSDGDLWAEHVYSASTPLITKLTERGVPAVSSTAPSLMAVMMKSMKVSPGAHVLEIGTGTGYNAAILSRLVGPDGVVVTIDIDSETLTAAAARLAGYGNVNPVHGDGRIGYPEAAPYTSVIVTGNTARLEPAWLEQLTAGGMLVANLNGPLASGIFAGKIGSHSNAQGAFIDYAEVGFTPLHGGQGPPPPKFLVGQEDLDHATVDMLPRDAAVALLERKRSPLNYLQLAQRVDRFSEYVSHTSPDYEPPGSAGDIHVVRIESNARFCEIRSEPDSHGESRIRTYGDCALLYDLARGYRSWCDLGAPEFWEVELDIDANRTRVRVHDMCVCDSKLFVSLRPWLERQLATTREAGDGHAADT